jgi:hypothetical protein
LLILILGVCRILIQKNKHVFNKGVKEYPYSDMPSSSDTIGAKRRTVERDGVGEMPSSDMPPWLDKLVDRSIQMLQNDTLKKKIQLLVLQPFIQYFIELIFPYVIIVCVVFGLLIILMISIIGLLVFNKSPMRV